MSINFEPLPWWCGGGWNGGRDSKQRRRVFGTSFSKKLLHQPQQKEPRRYYSSGLIKCRPHGCLRLIHLQQLISLSVETFLECQIRWWYVCRTCKLQAFLQLHYAQLTDFALYTHVAAFLSCHSSNCTQRLDKGCVEGRQWCLYFSR